MKNFIQRFLGSVFFGSPCIKKCVRLFVNNSAILIIVLGFRFNLLKKKRRIWKMVKSLVVMPRIARM